MALVFRPASPPRCWDYRFVPTLSTLLYFLVLRMKPRSPCMIGIRLYHWPNPQCFLSLNMNYSLWQLHGMVVRMTHDNTYKMFWGKHKVFWRLREIKHQLFTEPCLPSSWTLSSTCHLCDYLLIYSYTNHFLRTCFLKNNFTPEMFFK